MSGYYNNNALDYDFDMFESEEVISGTATAAAPQRQMPGSASETTPDLKVVKGSSGKKKTKLLGLTSIRSAFVVIIAMVLLGVVALQISVGAQSYELSSQIRDIEKKIAEAKTENIRLSNALNSVTTIENIDAYAQGILGMTKSEPYQIKCIDLSGGDRVLFTSSGGATSSGLENGN